MSLVQWFHCDKCQHVFPEHEAGEPETDSERSEHFGQVAVTTTYYTTCPCCGSTDLGDHSKCDTPDCLNECLDGCDDCRTCFEENDPEEFREYALKWLGESDGEPCDPREVR